MTPDTRTALEKIRKFIEYARYELKPGPPVVGTQFPTQVCADKELARIDALLSTSPEEAARPERHGYGCPDDGDDMEPGVNCANCCRHGWVEAMQGKPCPKCVAPPRPTPMPPPAATQSCASIGTTTFIDANGADASTGRTCQMLAPVRRVATQVNPAPSAGTRRPHDDATQRRVANRPGVPPR